MKDLLEGLKLQPPATEAAIARCSAFMGGDLPPDYEQFLRISDRGEGPFDATYLILWSVDELIVRNAGLHVDEYIPGVALIGSDGGGEAFAFDKRSKPWSVVMVPFVGLLWEDTWALANSFTEFLQRIRRGLLAIEPN